MTEIPDLPELRIFDPRSTRSAVFRGLLRTALLLLAAFVAAQASAQVLVRANFRLHDRNDHFDRVLVQGWIVGHPGVAATFGQGYTTPHFSWLSAREDVRFDQPDGEQAKVSVHQDLLGHVSLDGDVTSRLDQVLYDGRASRAQSEAFLRGLPSAALTDIVLTLASPLSETAAADFAQTGELRAAASFYEDPFAGARAGFRQQGGTHYSGAGRNPVSWPAMSGQFFRGGFSDWTAELSSRDDANLSRLGLPDARTLKELGRAAQVHGFLFRDLTPAQLRALLGRPGVVAFTPVDVRFDILGKDVTS